MRKERKGGTYIAFKKRRLLEVVKKHSFPLRSVLGKRGWVEEGKFLRKKKLSGCPSHLGGLWDGGEGEGDEKKERMSNHSTPGKRWLAFPSNPVQEKRGQPPVARRKRKELFLQKRKEQALGGNRRRIRDQETIYLKRGNGRRSIPAV